MTNLKREPEFDKEADTQPGKLPDLSKMVFDIDGQDGRNLAERTQVDTKAVVTVVQPQNADLIEAGRSGVRSNIMSKVMVVTMSAGLGIGAIAAANSYLNSEADKPKLVEMPKVVNAPVESADASVEVVVDTPEKLLAEIRKLNVPLDLQKFAGKNRFINGLMLHEDPPKNGKDELSWQPIESKKFKQAFVLAFQLAKPEYKDLIGFVGNQPKASVVDDKNPQIMYVYYDCVSAKLVQKRGAAVVVKQPRIKGEKKQDIYLSSTDITLPLCD